MKRLVMWCLILFSVVLLACQPLEKAPEQTVVPEPVLVQEETALPEDVPAGFPPPEVSASSSCSNTSQCVGGQLCINSRCGQVADYYQTDCPQKCTMKEIEIETSDGQTFTIPPGQGSYTAAGALSWTTQRLPPYCPTETVTVPFVITKKSYSTVYGEEMVAVQEGETSAVITHPVIPRIAFTLTVKNVVEECS